MKKPSITNALKQASKAVSMPIKTGPCSWVVYAPWDEIDGPSTSIQRVSYTEALEVRRYRVAILAAKLLDLPEAAIEFIDYATSHKGLSSRQAIIEALEYMEKENKEKE